MTAAPSITELGDFVREVESLRDTAYVSTITAAEGSQARGENGTGWFVYAHTLSILYRCTGGEYGTPIDEQLSPFAEINGGDRKTGGAR